MLDRAPKNSNYEPRKTMHINQMKRLPDPVFGGYSGGGPKSHRRTSKP